MNEFELKNQLELVEMIIKLSGEQIAYIFNSPNITYEAVKAKQMIEREIKNLKK